MVLPRWAGSARPEQPSGASRAFALVVAALAALGIVATWALLVQHPRGSALDDSAVDGSRYGSGTLWQLAEPVLDVVSVGFIVAAVAATMLVAFIRRRWSLAFQAAALVAGANITTQLLKHLVLQRPDGALNTLPSGHTTVAASVSVALLLVVPRSARPALALVGAAYTGATGVATMVGQWHRPSDVIAAVLVVLAWTGVVCALTTRFGLDPRQDATATTITCAVILLLTAVVAGAGGLAVLAGSDLPVVGSATASSPDVRAYVGTAALVAATVAATFGAALLVRQSTARPAPAPHASAATA